MAVRDQPRRATLRKPTSTFQNTESKRESDRQSQSEEREIQSQSEERQIQSQSGACAGERLRRAGEEGG